MKTRTLRTDANAGSSSDGFSRLELTVIIAVVTVLATLQLAAINNTAEHGRLAGCKANLQRLSVGWLLYAESNNGRLVGNYQGGEVQGGANRSSWCAGWLDWTTSSDNTNVLLLIDPRYARLAASIKSDRRLFKCPEDNYLSSVQQSRSWLARARSYSMNSSMGEGNYKETFGSFYIYKKLSDLNKLRPSAAFVFLDEQADSINDPCFFVNMTSPTYIDLPGSYHFQGSHFSFADGHVELKRWEGPKIQIPVTTSYYSSFTLPASDPDYLWLKSHAAETSR